MGRNTSLLAIMTLLSRFSGQLRSILLVLAIGATGMVADSFDIANNIPASLNLILTGGVFNAILVPQFVKARKFKDADLRTNKLLTLSIILMLGVTTLLTVGAAFVITVISNSNWTPEQHNLAVFFGFLCMPQIFFYGLYTVLGQVLAVKEKFGIYGFAPVMNNIVSCVILLAYILITGGVGGSGADISAITTPQILLLGLGATLGIAAQAFLLIIPLRKEKFHFRFKFGLHGFGLRVATKTAVWSLIAILVQEVAAIALVSMISGAPGKAAELGYFGEGWAAQVGGNAAWTNSMIIFLIPHSLVTISLITTMFTKITKLVHEDEKQAVSKLFIKTSRLDVYIMMAFTFLFVLLSVPITKALLPSTSDIAGSIIGLGVAAQALRLVPIGVFYISTRVFFAYEKTKWFFLVDAPTQIGSVAVCFLEQFFIPPEYWIFSFAATLSIFIWLESSICQYLIRTKLLDGVYPRTAIRSITVKTLICGFVASIPVLLVQWAWTGGSFRFYPATTFAERSWLECVIYTVIGVLIFSASYFGLSLGLKVPEARSLQAQIKRRLPGGKK
jgi:putative peptidoglycan lipid II flippase